MQPAVFLDRDNTLIANEGDLGDPEEVRLINGVAAGLRRLRDAGYRLVVVTNQGGVARGKYTEAEVDAVHLRIAALVDESTGCANLIERFYYCPYHPEATVEEYRREHPWRKPNPGMMVQAARDLGIDLARSWLIGDQVRDIEAGRAAGCRTILVGEDEGEIAEARPTAAARCFDEAVDLILQRPDVQTSKRPNVQTSKRPNEGGDGGGVLPLDHSYFQMTDGGSPALAELANVRRAMHDLAEEIRTEHLRRREFTPLRMAAGVSQLLVLLLALLGLMQLNETEVFLKWMAGAGLVQLLTIAILLADRS